MTDADSGKVLVIGVWESESDMLEANEFYQQSVSKLASVLDGTPTADLYELSIEESA